MDSSTFVVPYGLAGELGRSGEYMTKYVNMDVLGGVGVKEKTKLLIQWPEQIVCCETEWCICVTEVEGS